MCDGPGFGRVGVEWTPYWDCEGVGEEGKDPELASTKTDDD